MPSKLNCHHYILPGLSSLLYLPPGFPETKPDFSCTVDDSHYLTTKLWIHGWLFTQILVFICPKWGQERGMWTSCRNMSNTHHKPTIPLEVWSALPRDLERGRGRTETEPPFSAFHLLLHVCAWWGAWERHLRVAGLCSRHPPSPGASVQENGEWGREAQPWPFSPPASEWLHATLCQQGQRGHGPAAGLSGAQVCDLKASPGRVLLTPLLANWPFLQGGEQDWGCETQKGTNIPLHFMFLFPQVMSKVL